VSEQAYPLTWPRGRIRTPANLRRRAAFHVGVATSKAALTVGQGLKRIEGELERLRAGHIVISSNLRLGKLGRPLTDQGNSDDPAVAVYFTLKGKEYALACDKWDRVADNLAAIAKHIEAMRGMERWGVGSVEQMFTGYLALPASIAPPRPWREVLGMHNGPATLDAVEGAYKRLLRKVHPDAGGSAEQMAELNAARDEARRELAA
jgi:hypothetical protein